MTLLGMEIAHLVGTWGLCDPPLEKINARADTADLLNRENAHQHWHMWIPRVFQCVDVENDTLLLTDAFTIYRANLTAYKLLKPPKFKWGEIVYLKKKLDRPRQVIEIGYHIQNKEIIYRVDSSDEWGRAYWFENQLIAAVEVDLD